MNFFFYHSYCLRFLLFVCGDVESNSGPRFDNKVRVLYSNIRGLEANLDELAVAGSGYDALVVLSLKFLIAAISQSNSQKNIFLAETRELVRN